MPGIRESIETACAMETLARKPGNVHPEREFEDLGVADLLLAGLAAAPILAGARALGVGRAIRDAARASREVSRSNANLGVVLLLAPLAASDGEAGPKRSAVAATLEALSVEDARFAYEAIREAQPGGLGQVEREDVREAPTVGLLEAMRLAADRDAVARQYATGFAEVFDLGAEALAAAVHGGCGLEEAVVWCHLLWMARRPDTLIERKCGESAARESQRRAVEVLKGLGPAPSPGFLDSRDVESLDAWLRADGNRRNPGASADLVAASLYVALRTGRIDPDRTAWRSS
jgi:triphosphoribosyl-dephospho-CoA synthase